MVDPSPPPAYNFRRIPVIASRHPLWEAQLDESPYRSVLDDGYVAGQRPGNHRDDDSRCGRDAILRMPGDSVLPLVLSVALLALLAALLLHALVDLVAAALVVCVLTTGAWLAPRPAPAVAEERVHG